jgi:hypothetical protein
MKVACAVAALNLWKWPSEAGDVLKSYLEYPCQHPTPVARPRVAIFQTDQHSNCQLQKEYC